MTTKSSQEQKTDSPDSPADTIEKAIAIHNKGDLVGAERIYKKSLAKNPDDHTALYRIGIIYLQTGQPKQAIPVLEKAASINTLSSDVLNNLGIAYFHTERYDDAEKAFKKSLSIDPTHAHTLSNFAALMRQKGDMGAAETLLQRAICFKRDYSEAHNNLASLFLDQSRLEEALAKSREALRHNPQMATAHNNIGQALKDMGKKDAAEEHFRKAIECDPNFADAYNNLGNILRSRMALNEAQKAFEKALEINPVHEMALYNLMMMFEFSHKLDEAANVLEKTAKINPHHPAVALMKAKLARRKDDIEGGIKAFEENPPGDHLWGMYSFFELGQLYDRKKEPQKAFEAFTKGNALHAKSNDARYIDKTVYPHFMDAFSRYFTKDSISKWTPPVPESKDYPNPVFILGFPRSGTTLLDQILSSHPDFQVAEEKPGIETVRAHIESEYGNFTDSLAGLTEDKINDLRRLFYETHARYEPWDGTSIFVDKFPLNTALAGIIYRLFPDAKIIFALRHPCDCVLSCFMQQFNLNPGMIHFLDIENAARFYGQTIDLWMQLDDNLPLNVYIHRYEDVVEDFRGSIAALLDFLEVPWNDAVLEYDKTARARAKTASTPSYSQVTEKIYTRARYRWERYRPQLENVLPILLPYAEKWGYPDSSGEDEQG